MTFTIRQIMPVSLYILIVCATVNITCQFFKIFFQAYRTKKLDFRVFFDSGGFPSAHSATMTSLAVVVGKVEGLDSALFATLVIYTFFIMYDATGVRLEAGKHAKFINKLIPYLKKHDKTAELSETKEFQQKYYETIGHTKIEVTGGLIYGILATLVILIIFPF